MAKLSPKLTLLSVLACIKELLLRSVDDGWSGDRPEEVAQVVDAMISHFLRPQQHPLPQSASILFAPTGPIQEIAMANGWHEIYLDLSAEFDDLEYLINAKTTRNS